jgi:hypothetical protein
MAAKGLTVPRRRIPKDPSKLTDKERGYVGNIARGMPSRAAAKAAGYSDSYSRVAAHRLGRKSAVSEAIASIRSEGRAKLVYTVVEAMKEADEAADFAISKGNAMALVKARELRAKLSGLLVDRVEVAYVDLAGSLARAEVRVLDAANGRSISSHGSIDWRPKIAGPEEAGPADGEPDPRLKNGGPEER